MREPFRISVPGPRGPLGRLLEQFGRPSGLLGRLAGVLMAQGDADDRWVVDLLDVRPDDRVLEVGFGPGVAIELIAERARSGFVAGVDPSDVMLRRAARRNHEAIRQGRVDLRLSTAEDLPFPDGRFAKACAIHSVYFWPDLEAGSREVAWVLVPGGCAILAVRLRRPAAFGPSRYGLTDDQVADVTAALRLAHFGEVTTERREIGRQTMLAIVAHRSPVAPLTTGGA